MVRQRTWWCDECETPLLGSSCESCGSIGRPTGRDLVPVFGEELDHLRSIPGGEWIPKSAGDFYLWSGGPDYYCGGVRIATIRFEDDGPCLRKLPDRPKAMGRLQTKSLVERMSRANLRGLRELEDEAVVFVRDIVATHPDRTVVIPFSGGKDSLVVSLLARRALPAQDLLHVFGDTGIEAPDTLAFISDFSAANWRIPLIRSFPNVDFFDMCGVLGPPSRIKRWCCSTQKAFPLSVVYNALGPVLSLCGVRRAESVSRQKHERVLIDTKISDELMACPIIEWSDTAVWQYILASGVDFNRAYRRGFRRVGCLHCPYNSDRSEALKKSIYPEEDSRWNALLSGYYEGREIHNLTQKEFHSRWKVRAGAAQLSEDLGAITVSPCDIEPDAIGVQMTNDSGIQLAELLKPFGRVRVVYDDGLVAQIIVIAPSGELLIEARHSRPRKHVRLTLHYAKSARNMQQRVIRQLTKLSACVRCGACKMVCPEGAIVVREEYSIDAERCTHCQKCVMKIRRGCIAAHATNVSGERKWA